MRIFDYVHIIKIESTLLHFYYLTMTLTKDQLDVLILWYGKIVYGNTSKGWPKLDCLKHPDLDVQYFHDNGLTESVLNMIGTATLTKGYILSKRAREIVKRREPLCLVIDLMSRVGRGRTLPSGDLADIVNRIPFAKLPEILACDDDYIRELAERKLRKRKFLASMR